MIDEKVVHNFGQKRERKRFLAKPRRKREDNIKIGHKTSRGVFGLDYFGAKASQDGLEYKEWVT